MEGRFRLCLVLVTAILAGQTGQAQVAPGVGYAPAPGGWPAQPQGSSVQQVGWHGHGYYPPPAPQPAVAPATITELLPEDRGFFYDFDSTFDKSLRETVRNSWFRLEYMLVSIDNPGNTSIGSRLANVPNVREPFVVSLPVADPTDAAPLSVARVHDFRTIDLDGINGIRGVFGVPFNGGQFEARFWGTEQHTARSTTTDVPAINPLPATQFIGISLLTDGVPGSTVLLNDAGLTASFTSQLWGTDANIYFNYKAPRLGFRFQPLLGFRHTEYEENVGVIGLFDNRSGLDPDSGVLTTPIERRIWSNANNFRYGLQTGFRSELVHEYFTLGVEPKVTFGANYYQAEVMTDNLRNSTYPVVVDDPVTRSAIDKTEFAPTFDPWRVRQGPPHRVLPPACRLHVRVDGQHRPG